MPYQPTPAYPLSLYSSQNDHHPYHSYMQEGVLHTVAIVASSVTLISTVATIYLFCRMQKRMRHILIMTSILGCFIRGIWYLIIAIAIISGKDVETHSALCQLSGCFSNLGNGISDFATMFIALHGALQVFRPVVTTFDVDDGIYAYRIYAYLIILVIPLALSSLAFVNQTAGYASQGVFCVLPSFPIWYRLVLAWIPRFVIGIVIIGLAIAVYLHVWKQLRDVSEPIQSSRTSLGERARSLTPPILSKIRLPFPKRKQQQETLSVIDEDQEKSSPPTIFHVPQYDQGINSNCQPPPMLRMPQYNQGASASFPPPSNLISPKAEIPESPAGAKDYAKPDYFSFKPALFRKQSDSPTSGGGPSTSGGLPSTPMTFPTQPWDIHGHLPNASNSENSRARYGSRYPARRVSIEEPLPLFQVSIDRRNSLPTSDQHKANKSKILKKSLRRVFVYPVVFVVLWIPPCIVNMMVLFPKHSAKSHRWLAILSTLSLTLMGGIYCAIFLWSEEPWRKPDGQSWICDFLGALSCARGDKGVDVESKAYDSPPASVVPSIKAASIVSGSGYSLASTGRSPNETVTQVLSDLQASPRSIDKIAIQGQHYGSTTSVPVTSRSNKPISFAPLGQHLGGSTISLAKQLAYERLNIEKQGRREHMHFQRRVSHTSGLSLGSRASAVTSLDSITEAKKREWWDDMEEDD